MIFLTEADVRRLLPMADAMALLREAFQRLAAGKALNQPRRRLVLPTQSVLHYMAASDGRYFGAKIYSTHPAHGAHFTFLLYNASTAEPLAIMEANYLGQIRTGAATGLATQWMANKNANTVGLIGAGFQARTQLEAVRLALPGCRVRVWSRSRERRASFAAECGVEAVDRAEQAVREAGVVITATNARDPVLEDGWIGPGTHVNAVGSNQARRRELPAQLVRRADRLVVDSLEQSRMESGDLILALEEEDWNRVTELQDVVAGKIPGRQRQEDVTIFKSNGLAVEDVICAGRVYERAVAAYS